MALLLPLGSGGIRATVTVLGHARHSGGLKGH